MVNRVTLVGHVGKDVEVNRLENDNIVASFSLAVSETYKDKNGDKKESTEWVNIVAWGRLGEMAEKHIKKGKQLYIEGRIKTRSWSDLEGNKRYATDIVANNIQFLGKKED